MLRTFNMGIGLILVVGADDADRWCCATCRGGSGGRGGHRRDRVRRGRGHATDDRRSPGSHRTRRRLDRGADLGARQQPSGADRRHRERAAEGPYRSRDFEPACGRRAGPGGGGRHRHAGPRSPLVRVARRLRSRAWRRRCAQRHVRLVCLAGFMRLVGAPLLDAFPNAILNIHPSLLPAFPGVDAQRQALEHGVWFTGATVHLVTGSSTTGRSSARPRAGRTRRHGRDAVEPHPRRGTSPVSARGAN